MAKTLNFNKVKKQFMTVTLADENETTLLIGTPTKKTLEEFLSIKDYLGKGDQNADVMDEFYALCAKIMSHNKNGKTITKEFVESIFDFEDIVIFIQAYTEFIQEVTSQKN